MRFTNDIAEAYVTSAILNEPEEVIPQLKGEGVAVNHFHNEIPKLVWRLANRLYDEGRIHEIEMLEFSDDIKGIDDGDHLRCGISKVRTEWCGFEYLKTHLKTLKQFCATRFAHQKLSKALQEIEGGETPEMVSDALRGAGEGIMAILEDQTGVKSAKQSTEEFADLLSAIHREKTTAGVPTSIYQIDNLTGGLGKNELWVVGAPTSCGKTVLMLQIMANFVKLGKRVLVFSLETEASMIHARLSANTQNIDMGRILGKTNTPLIKSDLIKIRDYIDEVQASDNLIICDEDSITMDSINSRCQQVNDLGALDLIVVDYIQLVTLTNTRDKARHEQVAEVTRTMKQLAKKYQCPILTATQLNDDGQVRESRAIGHDADVLLTIGEGGQGIFVAKNRSGERGHTLNLNLNGSKQRFE